MKFVLISTLFIIFVKTQVSYAKTKDWNLKFLQNLPQHVTNVFLGSLFNSSISNILKIADQFKFCTANVDELEFLHFASNQSEPFEITINHNVINVNLPTKILIHGWFGTGSNDFIKNLASQYNKRGKYNVIGVDWSRHSKRDYIASSCTTQGIGKAISEFVLKLVKNDVEMLGNIHLIGHSLGAQVAAFAGQEILNKTGRKIGRITGLDTAAPLFEFPIKLPKNLRLDAEDAEYVDGIHTNMGFFGFASAYGTADFFVENGSPVQPGCKTNNFFEDLVCSHSRSVELFQESIHSKKLIGLECPNPFVYRIGLCTNRKKAVMGEYSPKTSRGNFYLQTFNKPPYGKG